MARSSKYSLRTFVHRVLVLRLALAGTVLAIVFGLAAFFTARDRASEQVVAHILKAADVFSARYAPLVSKPGLRQREAIQKALGQFATSYEKSNLGKFVLVRIYSLQGDLVAENLDKHYEFIEESLGVIDNPTVDRVPTQHARYELVRTHGGRPYLTTVTPLRNSSGELVGSVAGVFKPSPSTIREIRGVALTTMLYVAGIVLITTALLYPVILRLTDRVSRFAVQLLDSNLEALEILGNAIALRDSDTAAHNYRVTIMAVRLAEELNLSYEKIRTLIKGAFLHDVGKIGIPDQVLLKPGKLTEEEFSVMKQHVDHGIDLVRESSWLCDAREVVGFHHEKVNGKGYLQGLVRDEIPITARVFAVVDVFDALTSKRPYKEPLSFEDTMTILEEGRGNHFDSEVLDAFDRIAGQLYEKLCGTDVLPRGELGDIIHMYFSKNISLHY